MDALTTLASPLRRAVAGLALAAALGAPAAAAGVEDLSYRTADGERVIALSATVAAPLAEAWGAFTTAEGFRRWAAPFARIDLRVGGEIEASYDAQARPGEPGNIRNRIVALVPQYLLVLQNVQAPANAPFDVAAFQQTQTVIRLEAIDANTTRIVLHNAGYRDGPGFDSAYRHFHAGNAWTLKRLQTLFAPPVAGRDSR